MDMTWVDLGSFSWFCCMITGLVGELDKAEGQTRGNTKIKLLVQTGMKSTTGFHPNGVINSKNLPGLRLKYLQLPRIACSPYHSSGA